jgi:hypothetical protein
MKRATITIPDEIQQALAAYCHDQGSNPNLSSVLQDALRDFLAERGYMPPSRALRITPAEHGSGKTDISTDHDRYLAER